tara:strand:+ start:116 stop:2005 length:1890 start_codon:yes stop_codon:yes gene_type:complete
MSSYEDSPEKVRQDMRLQYQDDPSSYLNFITRNISFKKGRIPLPLFDPEFSYIGTNLQSGFGWEDIEAGYRLFAQGFQFAFTYHAFTVHLSHPSTTDVRLKPLRSMRNFRKLLTKHPHMLYSEAGQWIADTYKAIQAWGTGIQKGETVFQTSARRSTRNIVVKLSEANASLHPFVIEKLLSQWSEGTHIYLVAPRKLHSSLSYYANLHDYVHLSTSVPLVGSIIEIQGDVCLDMLGTFRETQTQSNLAKLQRIGGLQSETAITRGRLRALLNPSPRILPRLKILTYRWHVGHQYELWKLPHDFYVVESDYSMKWDYRIRPLPSNTHFIDITQVDPSEYDLAILHFDENCLNPRISAGTLPDTWGGIFRQMLDFTQSMPRVAICHGTPPFHGMFQVDYSKPNLGDVWTEEYNRIRRVVGDMPIVCNSYKAWEQWSFPNSRVIWQGFDSREYPLAPQGDGVLFAANAIRYRPWYRGYYEFKEIAQQVACTYMGRDDLSEFHTVEVPDPRPKASLNLYAEARFASYQSTLARFQIFLDTTLRSPMPRTRAEAMLKGLVCVTTDHHDESMFIENGVNGFVSNDTAELMEYLRWNLSNPEQSRQIALRGRRTVERVLSSSRYLEEWAEIIQELL